MLSNRKPFAIAIILFLLVSVGVAFQNCAQPLDQSLLLDSELPEDLNPEATGKLNYQYRVDQPSPLNEGDTIFVSINVVESKSNNYTFSYELNGQRLDGSNSYVRIDSVKKNDELKIIGQEGSDIVEKVIKFNVTTTPTVPPVPPPVEPPVVGEKPVYIKRVSKAVHFVTVGAINPGRAYLGVRLDAARGSDLSNIEYKWEKIKKSGYPTFKTTYEEIPNQTNSTFSPTISKTDYSYELRVTAYSTVTGKTSNPIHFKIVADNYIQSIGAKATKSPRAATNLPQCEVPYFLRGVITYYTGTAKGGYQVKNIICGLLYNIDDEESTISATSNNISTEIFNLGTSSNTGGKGISKGVYSGTNYHNRGVSNSHTHAISGLSSSAWFTKGKGDEITYSSPELGNTHAIGAKAEVEVSYSKNTFLTRKCAAGQAVIGIKREQTDKTNSGFPSYRNTYYYKASKLVCGKVQKLFQ